MAHLYDTKGKSAVSTTNPHTLAYTCGSGATVLVVGICMKVNTGQAIRSGGDPTYAGIPMIQCASSPKTAAAEVGAELWFLPNPPTGSSNNISVPNSGGLYMTVIASSYKAASGLTTARDLCNGQVGTGANPSTGLTTTADGEVIVDVLSHGDTAVESGNNKTLLYATDEGQWNTSAQYELQSNYGLTTFTHTQVADNWAHIVLALKEALGNVPNSLMMMGAGT